MVHVRNGAFRGAIVLLLAASCSRHGETRNAADFTSSDEALKACAAGTTLPGLDVSSYQLNINWTAVAGSGIKWAYAKATEGTSYQDSTFRANWSGMKANGVVRGAYHFFHPGIDGRQQADYFLDFVGGIGAGDLPPMLDWEVSDNVSGATASANGEAFIQEIAARTGKSTVIYTAPGLWNGFGIPGNFGSNPLFVANWLYCDTAGCCPSMPNGWSQWVFWQWSDSGNTSGNPGVPGVPARVDLDVFNGTESQLMALTQGGGSTSSDPCSGVPAADSGLYCGTSTENGFGGGNAQTLYDCVNSVTQSTIHCLGGCVSEPPGTNDVCATSTGNPCAAVPASQNGLYCGSETENGFAGGSANILYDCVNGATASQTQCPAGCTIEPVGTNDACAVSSTDPCASVPASANGLYCGSETENGFGGGSASTLYDCVSGSTVSTTTCPNGCLLEPVGTNDRCASAANPCGTVPASANGLYCGSETENGFAGGDPNTLYDCVNGATAGTTSCPNGCRIEPAGTNDACVSNDPCSPVPASANGLYCGTETEWGFGGGDPHTLYDCVNGMTASTTACPYGCIVEPMGTNDACNPSSSNPCAPVPASANGLYCGNETENGFGGGAANTLYDCVNGTTTGTTSCPNGCTIEPRGTNDMCTPSPTDPCARVPASADGLYCGGSTENGFSGGTGGTLYDCENGSTRSTLTCPNGCTMEPPGMDDYCTPMASNDPCASVPAADNGIYCGTSTENGFTGGDPNTLYDCVGGMTTSTTHCASGCVSEPPGMNDICTPPPPPSGPCAAVPANGNGTYCGGSTANGFSGGTAGTLYTCENGATTATFPCADGCVPSTSGTMDSCAMAPSNPCANVPAADNGTYCGGSGENGFGGGDLNLLYTCQNGQTASTVLCPGGCVISASGSTDACAIESDAGGVPDSGESSSGDAGMAADAGGADQSDAGEAADAGDAGPRSDAGGAQSSSGSDAGRMSTVKPGGCRCTSGQDVAPGVLAFAALLRRRRSAARSRRD